MSIARPPVLPIRSCGLADKTFNDDHDDPELFVRPQDASTEAAYREFWSLQQRAFRRVGTATRRWVTLQQKALAEATTAEQKATLRSAVLKRSSPSAAQDAG